MVPALHALGVKPLRMLTGDNKATAQRVAEGLKLDGFDADLLPADKLRIVGEMADAAHARKRTVAVIGDGVNDAPALARADVGMAIGTIGTAAALESADVVLLSESLHTVPWAIKLARRARQTIVANLILALSIIVIMGITTLIASRTAHPVPLSIGVLAHEGGTVLVVLNSLRLLWFKKHD
jgi:Cd2+/Zn2+-exporting ATPase